MIVEEDDSELIKLDSSFQLWMKRILTIIIDEEYDDIEYGRSIQ
jgi:hypothetical protein